MNYQLLARFLGILSLLIGAFMLLSLLWAFPELGFRTDSRIVSDRFEREGFLGLLGSTSISWAVGALLLYIGRKARPGVYRREAMAIVGLSWILATVLGALPYVFSGSATRSAVKLVGPDQVVHLPSEWWKVWKRWEPQSGIDEVQHQLLLALVGAGPRGISGTTLVERTGNPDAERALRTLASRLEWQRWLLLPGSGGLHVPADRVSHYRIHWVPVGFADALFESQSGFSTTGATTFAELNDPWIVPHCILFWRASTHFLGGLGIIVLFVVILGQGSVGKVLMRAEMTGPSKEGTAARMQHTAWMFAGTYLGLNVILAIWLMFLGMTAFDALCHSFATLSTGGFGTYTASVTHFQQIPGIDALSIELAIMVFMFLGGANFLLILLAVQGRWAISIKDPELRFYALSLTLLTVVIAISGWLLRDPGFGTIWSSLRLAGFQLFSLHTNTGFVSADFDRWNDLSRMLLMLSMFMGGCSGSTAGGMKVIRFVLLSKIMRMEIEHAYHPNVVRLLRVGGKPVEDQEIRRNVLVFCGIMTMVFLTGWILVVAIEPATTWNGDTTNKLIDVGSAMAASMNNCGPGLGVVGATLSFSEFCSVSKLIFTFVMMVGRLEFFPLLVLFMPGFWKDQ